jgi:alpha-glucosidase
MPWTPGGEWKDPWLPLEDTARNLEDQRSDPESTLAFTRDLIAVRRSLDELRVGPYAELPAPEGAWAWRRGAAVVVAVNLGSDAVDVDGVEGEIALATARTREGERIAGRLSLGASEGAIVRA